MVGSTGMPLLPLDYFRFSVCHAPFAPVQCHIAGVRDRVRPPRVLSKNIRKFRDLSRFFLGKIHIIDHESLVQCVRGKMVREFNLILHKKIRISDDLIPIASKDIFLDFARNCWHAAQLVGNKNSNCSLFCCFKI